MTVSSSADSFHGVLTGLSELWISQGNAPNLCGRQGLPGTTVELPRIFSTGARWGRPSTAAYACAGTRNFDRGCLYNGNEQSTLTRKGREVGTATPSC